MSLLSKKHLLVAFQQLGDYLRNGSEALEEVKYRAVSANPWFTLQEVNRSIAAMGTMLHEPALISWFEEVSWSVQSKKVGLILAGNLPMVGFHDVICVLASGHQAVIKLSSNDRVLLPHLFSQLIRFLPELTDRIQVVEQLREFDAVIATGNNNSSRYFDYYFGKVPHIIRRNRNSVAVLSGHESDAEIVQLGHDIFDYFGLGCRNVSKIFVPHTYEIKRFFEPLEVYKDIINHHKYHNNYDYNKSVFLVNQAAHYDNGFLLLKEDQALASPLAVLYYERYSNLDDVATILEDQANEIQCVLSCEKWDGIKTMPFGQSQCPQLWDYADEVDTLAFLKEI